MDSPVALALMAKAKLVFETEGENTYLSFPLSAIAYEREDLSFMTEALTAERLLKLTEFSQLVNQIPSGVVWPPTEERYLWDVYKDVLVSAKLASSTRSRTPEEEADYQKAFRFLHEVGPDGSWASTAAVTAYKQYRDAWIAAKQTYGLAENDATYSTDAAVKQRWETVDKPALRQQILDLEQEWATKGYRAQYDEAKRIEEQFAGMSPITIWNEWRIQFIPDLDKWTDAKTLQSSFPSGFSPSNVLEAGGWNRFTLTENAVNGLAQGAPPELRNRLAPDQLDLDIESMSFEVTSVGISRAWLIPDVFKARFWRFYDDSMLSNGQPSPAGLCPAYVAALVLARNLEIKLKPQSLKNAQAVTRLQASPALSLATFKVAAPVAAVSPQQPMMLYSARRVPAVTMTSTAMPTLAPAAPMQPTAMRMAAPPSARMATPATTVRDHRAIPPMTVRDHRADSEAVRMRDKGFYRPPRPPVIPPPSTTPSAQPPVATPTKDDNIYVLAFICKRVPLCPNPDSALQW
jgi:hypothetical protein